MKPIYKILIVIGIIILIGLGIYLTWKKITVPPSVPEEELSLTSSPTSTGIYTPTPAQLKKISDQEIFNYWVISDTQEIYYFTPEGKVFSVQDDNNDIIVSNQIINALNNMTLSPDKQKVLASFGDPRQPQWGIFDLIDKVWRPLPAEIMNAAWEADDDHLIATINNQNQINLSKINLLESPPVIDKIIDDFRFKDINLLWQSPQQLLLIEKPAVSYHSRVWILDLENLTFQVFIEPTAGLITQWTRDHNIRFTFNSPNNFKITEKGVEIPFPLTLPQKCTAELRIVYCFVPQEIPQNTVMPDDYFQKKFYSIDNLFSLNLEKGSLRQIPISFNQEFNTIDAKFPQMLNNSLYFINRYDNYLYKLDL